MVPQENNYFEQINRLTNSAWQPLLDLISEIKSTREFGDMKGGEKREDGRITMPYWVESSTVSKFRGLAYRLDIIISFDWASWDEGRAILSNQNFDFNSIDIPTKCKLITAIVRNDRFSEGALVETFESGLMLQILESINTQLAKK